jgi:cellulose synthase (UDP-forming)
MRERLRRALAGPDGTEVAERPYAPVPTSLRPTGLRVGSAFQRRPRLVQALALAAMIAGAGYLSWRVVATAPGVSPLLFWPLWTAELWGYVAFLSLVLDAWRIDPTPRPAALDLATDIVIATYDEDVDVVEPTIVGALRIRGRTTVHLCDDGRRDEMRVLAEQHGIRYVTRPDNRHAKAGNINAVLPTLEGELVLILDADHVPSPDLLEATSGYFRDPSVAVVQTAHSFRNHNSVMHDEEGRHEQSLFFDVLLPGRDRIGSAFWAGSAAVLRTEALRTVGGLATRTSTEDFETSLLLQRAGYRIHYLNEHLVQGLAPDTLGAYLTQRSRWAEGTLASYRRGHRAAWSRDLTLAQRLSYTGGLLYYLTPLQRLVYSVYLVLVGILGVLPVGTLPSLAHFLVAWGSWTVLSLLAVSALERGSTGPAEGVRNLYASFEAFLRAIPSLWSDEPMGFAVTPKNETDIGGWHSVRLLRLPIALALLTVTVLAVRWTDTARVALGAQGWLPPVPPFALLVITLFGLVDAVIIARFAVRLWFRRQFRALWRFPVGIRATVDGAPSTCLDLHQRGAAVTVDAATATRDVLAIALELTTSDGRDTIARGRLTPTSRSPLPDGHVRVGGPVDWDDRDSRLAVIDRCYVVEPYGARRAFLQRRAPRFAATLPARLGRARARLIDVSAFGAAFRLPSRVRLAPGSRHRVEVRLPDGRRETGWFSVLNVRHEGARQRAGGEMEWRSTDWIGPELLRSDRTPPRLSRPLRGRARDVRAALALGRLIGRTLRKGSHDRP